MLVRGDGPREGAVMTWSLFAAARGALFGPIPVAQMPDAVPRVEAASECAPIPKPPQHPR
jgi:hypothetical protein